MNASSEIRRIIDRVEIGEFDDVLHCLEGEDLGIWIPACEMDGTVVTMPPGYSQEETAEDLAITISREAAKDAVRVAWSGSLLKADADCIGHGNCQICVCTYCYDTHNGDGDLTHVIELNPTTVEARVKAMCEDGSLPMDRLDAAGLSVFMVHGHGQGMPFTTLPNGIMAVIEDGHTRFRRRADALKAGKFVPTTWRFEEGERQPVGGFA